MPEYLAPGLYIEEIARGPRPIEGVATSTAAFLGETARGPTQPTRVTSFDEYRRHFGGDFGADKFLPYAIRGFFENGGRRALILRLTGAGAQTARARIGGVVFVASEPGAWGNRIFVKLSPATEQPAPSFRAQIAYWDAPAPGGVYPDPFDPAQNHLPRPAAVEEFDNLDAEHAASVLSASALIRLDPENPAPLALPLAPLTPLAGGADGAALQIDDFKGDDSARLTGLAALAQGDYREVALVAAPGVSDIDICNAICAHCESNFRFAALDCPPSQADASRLDPRQQINSSHAAFYYPWLVASDLLTGARRHLPPSGHVLGVYARTDVERGVWKAPANETLRGVVDLEYEVDDRVQEVLNPRSVNTIRRFPGRGLRVWGARTLSADSQWRYIAVRRLFIFLEQSIHDSLQWVVFEPNDERLWARVVDTIRLFLRTQWRNGAFPGATENDAFSVRCDATTMTQDDIANGRLICEIGVAPLRPAEFVIFRVGWRTADAS